MKVHRKEIVAEGDGSLSVRIDITPYQAFAVQLVHGAGSSTTAKLQASIDDVNYEDIPNSSTVLATSAGSQIWDDIFTSCPYLKVVVTGDAVDNVVYFVGNSNPERR